jgi:hypothetical protein
MSLEEELKLKRIYILLGAGFISLTPEIEKIILELEKQTDYFPNDLKLNPHSHYVIDKQCNNIYCNGNCTFCRK